MGVTPSQMPIVFAHPRDGVLRRAAGKDVAATRWDPGTDVAVSDLYAMRFDSIAGPDDFTGERADNNVLHFAREHRNSFEEAMPIVPPKITARRNS